MPMDVYISYAPEDEGLIAKLRTHLAAQRQIQIYSDSFAPDVDRIDSRLASAPWILLALSPDYVASEALWGGEAAQALSRHHEGTAQVVVLCLRPLLRTGTALASVPTLPRNGEALSTQRDMDAACVELVRDLLALVKIGAAPGSAPPDGPQLHSLLCQLLPAQFAEVIYRLGVPPHVLPSDFAPQGMRATALLQYVEQRGGIGYVGLWTCIRQVAPSLS